VGAEHAFFSTCGSSLSVRVAAEMASPYPPGVPVLAPGERISADVLDYLTSGIAAGMLIPDAADPQLKTLRVVAD
jgi:arginine/lysine/ornithine decarboxylase